MHSSQSRESEARKRALEAKRKAKKKAERKRERRQIPHAEYVAARADDPKKDRIVVGSVYAKRALVKYGKLNAVTLDELAASCL